MASALLHDQACNYCWKQAQYDQIKGELASGLGNACYLVTEIMEAAKEVRLAHGDESAISSPLRTAFFQCFNQQFFRDQAEGLQQAMEDMIWEADNQPE